MHWLIEYFPSSLLFACLRKKRATSDIWFCEYSSGNDFVSEGAFFEGAVTTPCLKRVAIVQIAWLRRHRTLWAAHGQLYATHGYYWAAQERICVMGKNGLGRGFGSAWLPVGLDGSPWATHGRSHGIQDTGSMHAAVAAAQTSQSVLL